MKGFLVRAVLGAATMFAMGMAAADGTATTDLDNARVTADPAARVLRVDGIIGPDFEKDVRDALLRDPRIRQVVVRSPGGMRAPALRVADFINRRGVTVRVDGKCASACVLLWATASSREMTATSRIGLHRSSLDESLPIPDSMRQELMRRNDRETDDVLLKAGFPTDVVAVGSATPASTMAWFDPHRLRQGGLSFVLVEARSASSMASAGMTVAGQARSGAAHQD